MSARGRAPPLIDYIINARENVPADTHLLITSPFGNDLKKCHRVMLSRAGFFQAYYNQAKVNTQGIFEMRYETDAPEQCELLIQYMYGRKLKMNKANVVSLMKIAHEWNLPSDEIESMVLESETICDLNAPHLMYWSQLYEWDRLYKMVRAYILQRLPEMGVHALCMFDKMNLASVIADPHLCVDDNSARLQLYRRICKNLFFDLPNSKITSFDMVDKTICLHHHSGDIDEPHFAIQREHRERLKRLQYDRTTPGMEGRIAPQVNSKQIFLSAIPKRKNVTYEQLEEVVLAFRDAQTQHLVDWQGRYMAAGMPADLCASNHDADTDRRSELYGQPSYFHFAFLLRDGLKTRTNLLWREWAVTVDYLTDRTSRARLLFKPIQKGVLAGALNNPVDLSVRIDIQHGSHIIEGTRKWLHVDPTDPEECLMMPEFMPSEGRNEVFLTISFARIHTDGCRGHCTEAPPPMLIDTAFVCKRIAGE